MMWKEFEEIAGYEVTYETYTNVIEPMYTALPDGITKTQFVGMLNKKAFALPTKAEMLREMRKLAKHLAEICGHCLDYEAEEKLDKIAKEYAKRFYGLDWSGDIKAYVYFHKEYEYEGYRGCAYPAELVIGRGVFEYERITLVK